MTTEQKAKAYDEAIERAEKALEVFGTDKCEGARQIFSLFPELKESDDERIKKCIIDTLKGYHHLISTGGITKEDMITWLKKQGEQNPVDKVEPKFNVGDIIKHNKANIICKVISVNSGSYYIENIETSGRVELFNAEQSFHLWTIQDAKDGDVLSDGTTIFIFKDLLSDGSVMSYCDYDTDSGDSDAFCPLSVNLMCSKITPTTKEQCDLLFQKMYEAGYEWDAEKKELKKIEPFDKYEGLTDFERTLADICIGWIGEELSWKQYIKDNADVLLRIAVEKFNSVQDVPFEQKPADNHCSDCTNVKGCVNCTDGDMKETGKPCWSEEDEERLKSCLNILQAKGIMGVTETINSKWLKSLKERL